MRDGDLSFTTRDIEYLRHGDRGFNLRLFTPAGDGPFPCIIDIHGGAWNTSSLEGCKVRDEVLAGAGFAVAALDFRHAADAYPSSLQDINYAIRWAKKNAADLNIDPARIGLSGQSSGGHLVALVSMRPDDPRYTEIPLEGGEGIDASVVCVAMEWPVINPLSRYHHALKSLESEETLGWVGKIPEYHHIYWGDEDTMAEGNPMLALERGEDVILPPALWLQGGPDIVHDYLDEHSGQTVNEPERYVQNYRNAGGEIEIIRVEQATRGEPDSFKNMIPFYENHLG